MNYKYTYNLFLQIKELQEKLTNESDWVKRKKILKRINKYQNIYNIMVTNEMQKEIIHIETLSRGF